jgi:hypothetical protein
VAFNELDVKRIDFLVGGLCRRRTRPALADQLRLAYEIDGQSVVLFEERPDWRDLAKRKRSPFAKLRFVSTTGLWTLYWRRADGRWHAYRPASPTSDLAALVAVVDEDPYGAFFG